MVHQRLNALRIGLIAAGAFLAASTAWNALSAAPVKVLVTITPQAYLAERIGGDRVEVTPIIPASQDPHTFMPTPRQMIEITRGQVFFLIGEPIEDRLVGKLRGGSGGVKVVDTTEGIQRIHTCGAGCAHHHHGHAHAHGAADPHVWLSPPLLKTQAKAMADALAAIDPQGGEQYRENYVELAEELDELHARITEKLKPYRGRSFYIFHPALGYFADTYGLKQKAVEVSGRTPTPGELRRLITEAKRDRADVLFVQPQFDQRSANAMAKAIDAELVTFDPLKRDVVDNLRELADELAKAFDNKSSE